MAWLALALLLLAALAVLGIFGRPGWHARPIRVLLLVGWPAASDDDLEAVVRGLARAVGRSAESRLAVVARDDPLPSSGRTQVLRALAREFPGIRFAICPRSDDPLSWGEPLLGGPPDLVLHAPAPGDPRIWLDEVGRRVRGLARTGPPDGGTQVGGGSDGGSPGWCRE